MKTFFLCVALSAMPADQKFLDGLAEKVVAPIRRVADSTEKVISRIDRTAAAVEFFCSWVPWAGGGVAGLFVGYILGRRNVQDS